MRVAFHPTILLLAVAVAGCGGSSASSPRATPTRTPGSGTVVISTIPPSTPPPNSKGVPTPGGPVRPNTPLPTLRPHLIATPTPFPATAYTAVLHGRVTDARSHAPLQGAIITLGNALREIRTGRHGRYRMAFPAGPPVIVQVTMKGYGGEVALGAIKPHQSVRLDFHLSPRIQGKPSVPPPPLTFGS